MPEIRDQTVGHAARDEADRVPTRRRRWRVQEVILVATFVGMAAYETAEIWILEANRLTPIYLAIAMHAVQVAVILAATWTVLRAWRQKSAHEEALATMVERVTFAQEAERGRIARELHDAVSPLIVAAKQHVETSRDCVEPDPARASAELARAAERLQQAVVESRRMLRALRPSSVDADGLAVAVRRNLDDTAQAAGWSVTFEENLGDDSLPVAVETAAFRIVQEAIANAARHARTKRLRVELQRETNWLRFRVLDEGVGIADGGVGSRGLGLIGMRERAELLGGACTIRSSRGGGTQVEGRLPLRAESGA